MNVYCQVFLLILSIGKAISVSEQCMAPDENRWKPNYCDEPNQPHLGCTKIKKWGKACGYVHRLYPMDEKVKALLIRKHNGYRNIVAKGTLRELPAASRMLKLQWDKNLAYLAEMAARQCTLEPITKSYSTPDFTYPGYLATYNKYDKDEEQDEIKIITVQLNTWFEQYSHMTVQRLQEREPQGEEVSYFNQLIYGLNNRFGCAVSIYEDSTWRYQLLVCLYGCNRKPGKPTYSLGKVPGSRCQCGSDRQFKNLCHEREAVGDCGLIDEDPNDSYVAVIQATPTTTKRPNTKPQTDEKNIISFIIGWIKQKVTM